MLVTLLAASLLVLILELGVVLVDLLMLVFCTRAHGYLGRARGGACWRAAEVPDELVVVVGACE